MKFVLNLKQTIQDPKLTYESGRVYGRRLTVKK